MTANTEKKEYVIDAEGKRLGRVATEAAAILGGKDRTDFERRTVAPVSVKIVNARLMDVSEKKRESETYKTYSGYPGGLKVETLGHLAGRRGWGEALRRTISGMLPKNRLRDVRLKNLSIEE